MAFAYKQKSAQKKSAFKSFGNFLALHMVKRLVRRNKNNQVSSEHQTDKEALDAGFEANSCPNGSIATYTSNGHPHGNSTNAKQNSDSLPNKTLKETCSAVMPGVFGLTNHGNTCFINSVTQCLSNTDLLAEYFVLSQYKHDFKNCRKDRSKKYGTKGEVTEQMAVIIKGLWMGQYTPDMTKTLKEVIGKYSSQYKGSVQHDSQEFLLWLFDKMHEDLNLQPLKKKPFVRKQSFRKTHKTSNENNKLKLNPPANGADLSSHSFIQKTFQGHYHSSLSCPTCKKKSETIDPYLCISLPLKQKTTIPIYVNVVYLPNKRRSSGSRKHLSSRTLRIGVSVEVNGKISHLRQAVAGECGIHSRLLAFADLRHDGFHEPFGDDKSVCDIPFSNTTNASCVMSLYAFEIPPLKKMTAGTLPRNFASKHKKRSFGSIKHFKESESTDSSFSNLDSIVIVLINKQGTDEKGKRFGRPLVFRTSRDVMTSELQSMILSQMADDLKNGLKQDRVGSLFQLQVMDGLPNKSYLSAQAQQPLLLPTVDRALENSPAGSPLHIRMVAEWDADTKARFFEKFPEEKVEHQDSVRLQKVLHQQPVTCSLQECFDLLTEDEELGPEDGWTCPHCNKMQYGTRKKLSLYTLPDIFVLHLKRFRVENGRRTKLTTRVEFPVTGLDMSKHLYSNDVPSPSMTKSGWNHSTSGHNNKYSPKNPDDTLYDLYAVCNHYGNLNSGHYTACCCNPLDGRWYLFDDEQTECIKEEKLSPESVYILFYQRRSSSVALSCGGASVNSVMSDHWSYSLPQVRQRIEFNSQSHLNRHAVVMNRVKSFAGVRSKSTKKAISEEPKVKSSALLQRNVNNNSLKIAAAIEDQKKNRVDPEAEEDSDDGGFASTIRPYAKGLRRQGSAVVPRTQKGNIESGDLRGRRYRSHRHFRSSRPQRSSNV